MNPKILVVGCSISRGHGLPDTVRNPELWVNKLFPNQDIKNVSQTGANNYWIFLETISELIQQHYDIVLVGWSAIPRYNFHVGLELYTVRTMLSNSVDIGLNNYETISGKWLDKIGDNLKKISNDHWDILDLIKYVNTLVEIQKVCRGGKIFFVNSLAPWPQGYFTHKKINLPSDLSTYEQTLLSVKTRDDDEIFQLYDMIHRQYQKYGGIKEEHWLNLYQSLRSMQIDDVDINDKHPGLKSQQIFVNYLLPILKNKLNQ